MAETAGLIQRINVIPTTTGGVACFWMGPHPTNTELFAIVRSSTDSAAEGAFKSSMVDALTSAYVTRQEVTISHGDDSSTVDSIRFEPS
jgi:hypothetical protein